MRRSTIANDRTHLAEVRRDRESLCRKAARIEEDSAEIIGGTPAELRSQRLSFNRRFNRFLNQLGVLGGSIDVRRSQTSLGQSTLTSNRILRLKVVLDRTGPRQSVGPQPLSFNTTSPVRTLAAGVRSFREWAGLAALARGAPSPYDRDHER